MTFLVADGVVPSNEERGYVLRRIIRRAVRHAYRLGARQLVTPVLVDATVETMRGAYPELDTHHELVSTIVRREEERFLRTLQRGEDMLAEVLDAGDVTGERAFFLHDTLGFPIDLTREIAAEAGRAVDVDGFNAQMEEQRTRARDAHKAEGGAAAAPVELYRELLDEHGNTDFTGREEYVTEGAKVVALIASGERIGRADSTAGTVDVIVDRTPFYAESGGQVGDVGTITTAGGTTARRARHPVRDSGAAHAAPRRGRIGRARRRRHRHDGDRRRSARRDPSEPHRRPTSSTPRCARCWGRM